MNKLEVKLEENDCLYCGSLNQTPWASENGFTAVRCSDCSFIYVNPRPSQDTIDEAVKTGNHSEVEGGRNVVTRRIPGKVKIYRDIIEDMYSDVWSAKSVISWLDVGAGFGEVVEAITELAGSKSDIVGIEPMKPKADAAKKRGLNVQEKYLNDVQEKYDVVSLFNVFSHIPDFRSFLTEMKAVLKEDGEILLETGNTADLKSFHQVPSELDLPDHLTFAGKKHIEGYLKEAGFTIIKIHEQRRDGLIACGKNIIKKLIGRKVPLQLPYTSPYRQLFIRAKLKG